MTEQESMQQTIDQLRQNAKSHKKTVGKLAAKVNLLTQERNELKAAQRTKWSTLLLTAGGCMAFGFLATIGAFGAYGWLTFIHKLMG